MRFQSIATIALALVPALAGVAATQVDEQVDLEARATQLVRDLVAGRFEAACEHFDAQMRAAASPQKMAQIWKGAQTRLGAFQKQTGTRREKAALYDFVFVRSRFEKAVIEVKVVFNSSAEVSGFFFVPVRDKAAYKAPDYVKRDRFTETEVTFGAEGWKLPGTLGRPTGDGPFPALVLVHGSGPNDRDETVGANQPFKDLAWGLASRGVVVLRYEKRTCAHGARMKALRALTVAEETVDDAALAAAFLATRDGVDPARVFVLGHSLGGMLIPRIAARAPKAAGFVVLAGPTRPLEDLILEQTRYIYALDGTVSAAEKLQLAALEQQVARVKSPDLKPDTPPHALPHGIAAPYWLDLRGYRPAVEAGKIERPLLILQGERDYQVTMQDFAGWKKALAGRAQVTLTSFPALSHLFVPGTGKSTPAEYQQAGHVDEAVIRTIGAWVCANAAAGSGTDE